MFIFLSKVGVVRFAMSDIIPNDIMNISRFKVFLIASVDSNYEVANLGDSALKKIKNPDMETQDVINELYKLYQGTQNNKGIDKKRKFDIIITLVLLLIFI